MKNRIARRGRVCTAVLMSSVALFAGCAAPDASEALELASTSQAIESRDFDDLLMTWGQGYDSASGVPTGAHCLGPYDPPAPTSTAAGQVVQFQMKFIESREELEEHLGVSVSGSGGFGWGSVSASAKFASDTKINSYSLYLVASTKVINATTWIQPRTLNEFSAAEYVRDFEAFRRRCGDQFLTGITAGGEFYAVFELKTRSEQEKKDFQASLSASGAAGSWSARAQFERAVSAVTENKEYQMSSVQVGGRGRDAEPPQTTEEILDRARRFPTIVLGEGARGISGTFNDYSALELPHVNDDLLKRQKEYFAILRAKVSENLAAIADREYILDNPAQFEMPDLNLLRTERTALEQQNLDLRTLASECREDVINACDETWTEIELRDLPRRLSIPEQDVIARTILDAQDLRDVRLSAQSKLNALLTKEASITCGPGADAMFDAVNGLYHDLELLSARASNLQTKIERAGSGVADLAATIAQARTDRRVVDQALDRADDVLVKAEAAVDDTKPIYKKAARPPCPAKLYKEGTNASVCGTETAQTTTKKTICANAPKPKCIGGRQISIESKQTQGRCGNKGLVHRVEYTLVCEKTTPKTCRDDSFGVESYKECRNPAFGVERMTCE